VLIWLAGILVVGYLAILAGLFLLQRQLLYCPIRVGRNSVISPRSASAR
jgi:hypothetical protein